MDKLGSRAEDVPTMRLLPKMHKDLGPLSHPQSRPVVLAATRLSSIASDMIANVLEPLLALQTPRLENKCTKEVLCQLEEAERHIREHGHTDVMVGSLDARALYSSLNIKESVEIV